MWRILHGISPLSKVALRILTAPVSSAATERSFSTFSFIHTKKRNRLTVERAGKICFLSHNWKLLHEKNRDVKDDVQIENVEQNLITRNSPISINSSEDDTNDSSMSMNNSNDSEDDNSDESGNAENETELAFGGFESSSDSG